MKTSKMKSTLSLVIAVTSFILWGSASAANGKIELKVTGSGANTTLEIDTNDVKCGNNKQCIQTSKGRYLTWTLTCPKRVVLTPVVRLIA